MMLRTAGLIEGRYRLGERLGGFEERRTWLAIDEQTGEKVVFKSLFFGPGTDWQQYRLFEREAQTLPKLDHPGIPRFLAAFWLEQPEGHYFCLVQQFVPGGSLDEWMNRGRRFEEEQIIELTGQLLEILEYLHSQDPPLVHRDIKPSNLILGEDGRVYLVDFGAVQVMGQDGRTLTAAGTFGYMAPEQFLGRAVPASDLYGLGMTLKYLLTGMSPRGLTRSADDVEKPEHPALVGWLGKWLQRMAQPDVSRRFADVQEAKQAFQGLSKGEAIYDPFVPGSDLERFVVQETNSQRLSVGFLTTGARKFLLNGLGIGFFLILLLELIAAWGGEQALLPYFPFANNLFICCTFLLRIISPWGVRLEIGEGRCSLSRGIGRFVLWRRQVQPGVQVELEDTKPILGANGEVQRRQLALREGKRLHRFGARLSDSELEWLLGQFRFHTDRLQDQGNPPGSREG